MQNQKINVNRKNDANIAIPDKLYFTIGEVAELCQIKQHVLRYWEQEFKQLAPSKRKGNRRYYRRKDILLVRQIRDLLYIQGFTIEGARTQLFNTYEAAEDKDLLKQILQELEELVVALEGEDE
jgi:DNA-binding transcriptional MerR regulator